MKKRLNAYLNPHGDGWPNTEIPGIGDNRLPVSASELVEKMARFRGWRRSLIHFPNPAPSVSPQAFSAALAAVDYAATHENPAQHVPSGLEDAEYYNLYPGEHYRLLAGFCHILKPKVIVEIGTFTGMSSRVLADNTDADCKIITFDIIPWNGFKTHLLQSDFDSGKVVQRLADLSDDKTFQSFAGLLQNADIIFVDGPKDGSFEERFFSLLASITCKPGSIMLVDDIRFENMVLVWDDLRFPKMDLTSFGHWSGTGLAELAPPEA